MQIRLSPLLAEKIHLSTNCEHMFSILKFGFLYEQQTNETNASVTAQPRECMYTRRSVVALVSTPPEMDRQQRLELSGKLA